MKLMKNKFLCWVKRGQTFLAACVGNFTLFTTGTCSIDLFSFLYHMVLYKLPPYIWRYGIVNENHRRITVNSLTAFKNKYTLATYIAYKLTLYHDLSESININKAFIYNQTIKIKTGKMRNKEGCCQPARLASWWTWPHKPCRPLPARRTPPYRRGCPPCWCCGG